MNPRNQILSNEMTSRTTRARAGLHDQGRGDDDVVKRCVMDSTLGRKPMWLDLTIRDAWTEKRLEFRKAREQYLKSVVIGIADSTGYVVTNMLSRSDEFVIYEVQSPAGVYSMRIDIQSLVEEDDLLVNRWAEVAREYYITKRVLFKVNDSSVRERIANIIGRALSTGYSSEAVEDLQELQRQINSIYNEKIQNSLQYLGTIITITLGFVVGSVFVYKDGYFAGQQNLRLLIFATTSGCMGGFFSVSMRLRQMTFEREIPAVTYLLYGFERMVVSVCGAVIALLAIKSGIVFEAARTSLYACLLVSVAAGFSETLIPNLLVKVETEKS
jgi:hypothetical protein